MRRRFFVEQVRNGHAEISGDDARHLTRVLRVEPGQRYEISDNRQAYLAEVETAHKERVVFRTLETLETAEPPVRAILCAAIIKFDHFEWLIEKATELGVAEIIPVIADRTERGLDKAAEKRLERWRRIALEASQQSRRTYLPLVHEARPLGEAYLMDDAYVIKANHRFALDEDPGGMALVAALPAQRSPSDEVAILVGPEGGWTPGEREGFQKAGWTRVTMGPLILRAETAAIAALSVIGNAWLVH